MKRLSIFVAAMAVTAQADAEPLDGTSRAKLDAYVDQQAPTITSNALAIWKLAEPGFRETQSSGLLQARLRKAGFTIEAGVAGMPTAFVAHYRTGPGPVVAIMAEFDALPGISQQADKTSPAPLPGVGAGHACGHNLLGAGAIGGAIAVRQWMQATGFKGEIRVYGAPAEEGGDGKAYLVRQGLFKDVDAVLHWHPGDRNSVLNQPTQGNIKTDFTFHGVSSHAAAAPEQGRSALEAVEMMDVGVAFLRQHMPDGSRIHSIITNGGGAPNVVPNYAQSTYYVRNIDLNVVRSLQDRVQKAARGAAMATETTAEIEIRGGVYPLLINRTLNPVAYRNLGFAVKDLRWSVGDIAQAAAIQTSLGVKKPGTEVEKLEPLEPAGIAKGGSTDVGDISYVVPTVGFTIAAWPLGTPAHSWASAAASGSDIGTKAAVVASKALAATAVDLMLNPDVIAAAKSELYKARGEDFVYVALFGDRAPPLDYTDILYREPKMSPNGHP